MRRTSCQTLEYDIFCRDPGYHRSRNWYVSRILPRRLQSWMYYASLSLVAERNHYVRPKLNEKGVIDIKDGRHPVVEQMITNDMFIANDTYLDNEK